MESRQNGAAYRVLWFSLLSGPVVWSIHFLAVYLLVEISCTGGAFRSVRLAGAGLLDFMLVFLSVAALATVAYGAFLAFQKIRETGGLGNFFRTPLSGSPARFMAISGLILNLVFALLIVMMGLPALFLNTCLR